MSEPDDDYDDDPDYEPDEFEEALSNCCGHFSRGVFLCGAAGSEDCDWDCPFSKDIGLTADEIEERDDREERQAFADPEYLSWFL